MPKQIQHLHVYPHYGETVEKSNRFRKAVYSLIPKHTFLPFFRELQAAKVRFTSRSIPKRYVSARGLLVNLGAGVKGKPGWVNVDIAPFLGINCVYDCRKSLPFPNNSVKAIFCEHFFEHIDYTEEVPSFLSECHRALEPGGVIRIIVPDMERYLRAYCSDGWEALAKLRPLDVKRQDFHYGHKYNTRMELVNMLFRQGHEHKFGYDYDTLNFLLHRYGFSTVIKQEFGKSLLSELLIDSPERESESLYVEAVK
jgi:predicted SAM-dependent methyltransferase